MELKFLDNFSIIFRRGIWIDCRWSRIARKLPGRTDNEIKNYWRTHMRKKAQERKKGMYQKTTSSWSSSESSSSSSSSTGGGGGNTSTTKTVGSVITTENKDRSFYDTGGFGIGFDSDHSSAAAAEATGGRKKNNRDDKEEDIKESGGGVVKVYSQDEIWNDIELSEDDDVITPTRLGYGDVSVTLSAGGGSGSCSSPMWDYCPVSLWMTGDDDSFYYNNYNQEDLMSLMNSSLVVGKDFI